MASAAPVLCWLLVSPGLKVRAVVAAEAVLAEEAALMAEELGCCVWDDNCNGGCRQQQTRTNNNQQ
jgi:hypothetical protein